MSLTYTSIIALLLAYFLPIEEASRVAEAIIIVVSAIAGLYGRYRAGGLTIWGNRV